MNDIVVLCDFVPMTTPFASTHNDPVPLSDANRIRNEQPSVASYVPSCGPTKFGQPHPTSA